MSKQQLESDQGSQDVGVQLALYFQRVAPTVTSEEGILADQNLLEVAGTIMGLSPSVASDVQPQTLSELMPLSDLQDPAKLQQLTERFTAMYDYTYGPSSGASSGLTVNSGNSSSEPSGAAAVLASVISSNGSVLGSRAQRLHRRVAADLLDRAHVEHVEAYARRIAAPPGKGPRKRRALSRSRCFRASPMPDALQTIRAAANDAELEADALYAAAVALWRERRRDEAIRLMDEALRRKPDFAQALSMGGYMLSECGKADAAMRFYRRALELDPSLVVAHVNLGKLLFGAGRFAEALGSFAAATALAPDDADAWCSLAGALRELGRLEESVEAAKRALDAPP